MNEDFQRLAETWQQHVRSTAHLSMPNVPLRCQAYNDLIALGDGVVPLALAAWEAQSYKVPWGVVLEQTSGHSVGIDPLHGDPVKLRAAWLEWGRQAGRLP